MGERTPNKGRLFLASSGMACVFVLAYLFGPSLTLQCLSTFDKQTNQPMSAPLECITDRNGYPSCAGRIEITGLENLDFPLPKNSVAGMEVRCKPRIQESPGKEPGINWYDCRGKQISGPKIPEKIYCRYNSERRVCETGTKYDIPDSNDPNNNPLFIIR